MSYSIQDLKQIATDKIMNVLLPKGVNNRIEGELLNNILSIIESIIGTTGTIFQGIITTESSGPVQDLKGNLAYITTQTQPGTYIYSNYGGLQITLDGENIPSIILITRVNNDWGYTILPINLDQHQFRDSFFTVSAEKGLNILVHSGGYPENAYIILRRKKRNSYSNKKKWSFLGSGNYGDDNLIKDLGCFKLQIPREPGVYRINLSPYLPFVHRTYDRYRKLEKVKLSGNKYALEEVNTGTERFCRVYNDIAIQIAYKTGKDMGQLNERWRFGEMVRLRYIAENRKLTPFAALYSIIIESIAIK